MTAYTRWLRDQLLSCSDDADWPDFDDDEDELPDDLPIGIKEEEDEDE